MGCFVPAKSAVIPLIDRIFTRIGAADDLIGGQSTFMVEMKDIQTMTEKATSNSLVIIDELGRGTSTGEGMAIAQAVIEYVHHHIGCKALVSTHFHELAHLEESLPSLTNARMAVEESGDNVTFLRKLIPGAASTSYGIYCAQLAGLPQSIIGRAYELLDETEGFDMQKAAPIANAASHRMESTYSYEQLPSLQQEGKKQAEAAMESHGIVQLSIFDEPAAAKEAEPAKRKASPKAEQLAEQLRKLDLFNLTPMQAMQWLNDMKSKLND
jgi:DNA mismatch repair protein MutS